MSQSACNRHLTELYYLNQLDEFPFSAVEPIKVEILTYYVVHFCEIAELKLFYTVCENGVKLISTNLKKARCI